MQVANIKDKEINKTKAFSVTMLRLMTLIETSWHVCQLISFRRVKQPDSYLETRKTWDQTIIYERLRLSPHCLQKKVLPTIWPDRLLSIWLFLKVFALFVVKLSGNTSKLTIHNLTNVIKTNDRTMPLITDIITC